jgi:hypothetical protein
MLSFKRDIYGAGHHVSADRISWHIVISPKGKEMYYSVVLIRLLSELQ